MTTLTSFFKTDLVDDHVADDVNKLIAGNLRPEYANTETITATKELTDNDCQFQFITASGADRTVELSPEATTNHVTIIYNSGASNNVVVKDDSGTYTFVTLAPDEWRMFLPFNAESWRECHPAQRDYKLSVTVSANDLVVALKHLDNTDPTIYRPIEIVINGTRRLVTAATSITLADGTNWFNAGSAELATKEIDYFCYAIWDSNSSVVAIAPARIPHGRLVSDFNSTSTNEKYLGNYANYTSTDDVTVIGRFAATLSAGAGYTWTVPTFTNLNLIQHPIYETRRLSWTPAHSRTGGAYTNAPSVTDANYQVVNNRLALHERHIQNATPGSSGYQTLTAPFSNVLSVSQLFCGFNATAFTSFNSILTGSSSTITLYKYDGTSEATASNTYIVEGLLFI